MMNTGDFPNGNLVEKPTKNEKKTMIGDGLMIVWQKWDNPYLTDDYWDKTAALTGHDEEDFEDKPKPDGPPHIGAKVVVGPHGLIPITEYNNPTAYFNLWTGHTNFHITHEVHKVISNCDGVETFDVISPLRFRLGVGMLYDAATVCNGIVKDLNKILGKPRPTLRDRAQELVDGKTN
jgi:hypothetical protein